MTEDLARLRGTRGVYLRHVENMERSILDNIGTFSCENEDHISELNALKNGFTEKLQKIKELDEKLLDLLPQKDSEKELEDILNREDSNLKIIAKIDRWLSKIPPAGSISSLNISNRSQSNSPEARINLPKLQLTKFDGDIINWRGFWDQYKVAIHENDSVSDIDKFQYLLTFLSDSAKSAISGLDLNSQNYKEAIQILKQRYGNTQVLISAHMTKFVQLPKIKTSNDVKGLRKMYDQIEISVRNLKSLDIDIATYGSLLVPLLNEKLPSELRVILSRKFENDVWRLDDMIKCLKTEVEAKERSLSIGTSSDQEKQEKDRKFSTSSFFANSKGKRCPFCDLDNHTASKCLKVTNAEARKQTLRKKGLCFICFSSEHLANSCKSSYKCHKCNQGRHHISICTFEKKDDSTDGTEQNDGVTATNISTNKNNILLQTATVVVSNLNNSEKKTVNLLFDNGSQRTYITSELRNRLKLPKIRTERLFVKVFGNKNFKCQNFDIVPLNIFTSSNEIITIEAICTPVICEAITNQNVKTVSRNYNHLKNLKLADSSEKENKNIDILIGLDYYYQLVTGEIIRGEINEPVALNTVFGWVIGGEFQNTSRVQLNVTTHMYRIDLRTKHSMKTKEINNPFEFDFNKLYDEKEFLKSEDDYVVKNFKNSIEFKNNRYITKLPIKKDMKEILPDNYTVAKKRLGYLQKQFDKNKTLFNDYDEIIKQYLNEGIVEQVDQDSDKTTPGKVHYMPHRGVIREDRETTKLRIVFDASSKIKGEPCLNDFLYSGPCLLPYLFDILLRFRAGKIGLVADIKQAFHQIEIAEEHRDLVRFLWYRDINELPLIPIILRFARLLFGLTSCPFLLNGTVKYHLGKYLPKPNFTEIIKRLILNLYVDDSTNSFDKVQQAIEFYEKSKSCLRDANFDLRKWASNNIDMQKHIKQQDGNNNFIDGESYVESLYGSSTKYRKVLGLNWKTDSDEFIFDLESIYNYSRDLQFTKRNVLRIAAMFFDPLGLIAPITLQPKFLFQELCKGKYDWDTVIYDKNMNTIWSKFLRELGTIRLLNAPRHVLCCEERGVEIHGFCDSSGKGYGACVFVRVVCDHGVSVKLWTSKCRLAPVKELSIPRLELMACLLLSRLVASVRVAVESEVKIVKLFCWTDSQIALWWIRQVNKEWKVWVQNRVEIIRDNVDCNNWFHVPTTVNPADICTRECSVAKLKDCSLWWNGPKFLLVGEEMWPSQDFLLPRDIDFEEKISNKSVVTVSVVGNIGVGEIVDAKRYGSLEKLLRVTTFVWRFLSNLKKKLNGLEVRTGELELEEIEYAKFLWVKYEQSFIKNSENYGKLKNSLNLFIDENNVIRCRSRLIEAKQLDYYSKNPILLRNDSRFTELIILKFHQDVYHNGVETTLCNLRNIYWIIRGRQRVKSVIRKCVICKLIQGKTVAPVETPALPSYRVTCNHAFENVGLDFAGPLYCKDDFSSVNKMFKCYILLFTCCVTRAVHLELTVDVNSQSVILALRRFIGRRGIPRLFVSDNFKSFKSTDVKSFCTKKGIHWKFILERSPWWGGFYERLIAIVKSSLKKVLAKAYLSYLQLYTTLTEIESVLNSRPLTYLNEDQFLESLTPNHLIYGRDLNSKCNYDIQDIDSSDDLRLKLKRTDVILQHFINRFSKEYLLALTERHIKQKNKLPNNYNVNLKV